MTATPMPWQPPVIDAISSAISRRISFLDGSDTGIGKTYSACFAAVRLNIRLGVICPMSVIPSWIEAAEATGARLAFVGNIESLKAKHGGWLRRRAAHEWEWNLPSDVLLVFDEVHRFKQHSTQNAKILKAAPRPVLMLSGTPFSGPHEAQAIGHQLGLFHWNDYVTWAGQNGCRYGGFGKVEFVGIPRVRPGAPDPTPAELAAAKLEILDRIHRQIHHTGRGIRIRKSDLGDLFPAIRRETRLLPANSEVLDAAYAEELEQLLAESVSGGVEFLRSRQISEFSKLPAVIDMIEDLQATGRSVLVFVNFRDSLERLRRHFEDQRPAMIYGGQDIEGVPREEERLRFQRDDTRLWLSMIQAGGIGISGHDLNGRYPRASLILPGVSAEQVIQADGRDHRAGGLTPVDHYFLFSDCKVERQIRARLEEKINNISTLLDGDLTPRV